MCALFRLAFANSGVHSLASMCLHGDGLFMFAKKLVLAARCMRQMRQFGWCGGFWAVIAVFCISVFDVSIAAVVTVVVVGDVS